MDPWFHGEEVCKFLEKAQAEDADVLVLVWRGGGKSGMITEPMPSWWLAKNPYKRVAVTNATGEGAAKMIRTSSQIITSNKVFQLCYPKVIPSSKWGEDGYYLDVSTTDDELFGMKHRKIPSLSAYGVRGNITGQHFNGGVIFDDLLNEETASSPTNRRRAERFFGEMTNTIDPGCPLVGCATRWNYDDYCGKIETGELQGPRGRIRVFKTGVTRLNKQTKRQELTAPHRIWHDDIGNEYEFGETFESLEAKKASNGHLFSALYYNEPVMDEDVQFDTRAIQFFPTLPPPFELGPVGRVGVECESQSSALMSTFMVMMRNENRRIQLEKLTTNKRAKHDRIRAIIQPVVADSNLVIRQDIWDREDNLGQEIRVFDKGTDDCLDALAYAILLAENEPDDPFPRVHIAIDPAFTQEEYSDWTAMVALCKFQRQFWVLDCIRFQTNRADYIVRMMFSLYDKFNNLAFKTEAKKKRSRKKGFSSMHTKRHNIPRKGGWNTQDSFDIDLSTMQRKRELEG